MAVGGGERIEDDLAFRNLRRQRQRARHTELWEFLTLREILEILRHEHTPQIRMALEADAHHVVRLALVPVGRSIQRRQGWDDGDRKSTRLNSSHVAISYAVFGLNKNMMT